MTLKEFISSVGYRKISEDLGVPFSTIYGWTGYARSPRPSTAADLIEYSKGKLTWEGIYQPYIDNLNS